MTHKMSRKKYEIELNLLQVQLCTMLDWIVHHNKKLVIVFEGRDAAGKGGAIRRIVEHLTPRNCRIVALPSPTEREKTQWYFQRYIQHLPAGGEIVIFDRSWYNRALVEHVMGFCNDEEYHEFMITCPEFERMLIRSGIQLVKYWFSVSDNVQEERFQARLTSRIKGWKLSPMDLASRMLWVEYSKAKDKMLEYTHTPDCPWYVIDGDVKRHARLNCIRHLLSLVPYDEIEKPKVRLLTRPKAPEYKRPAFEAQNHVPKYYP